MPRAKARSYTVNKSVLAKSKREARLKKTHTGKDNSNSSYLSEDENFTYWSLQLETLGLELRDIPADGNCLFSALADQLDGQPGRRQEFRSDVCQYMTEHQEDFEPFHDNTHLSFDKHISLLRKTGTFAGNDAIVAFSRLYKVTIVIHHLKAAAFRIEYQGEDDSSGKELHLAYHNGEHYSSVRRIGDRTSNPALIKFRAPSPAVSETELKIQQVRQSTGCMDWEFIKRCLDECEGDVETTTEYINSQSLYEDSVDSTSTNSSGGCSLYPESSGDSTADTGDSTTCTCRTEAINTPNPTKLCSNTVSTTDRVTQNGRTKAERKREKKKRAEEKHKVTHLTNIEVNNNKSNTCAEIYEVTSQVALLSV